MHGGPVEDESLVRGEPEHGAVVVLGLFGGPGGGVFRRVPGVEVSVEMEDCDGAAVDFVEASEGGEGE